MTNTNKTEQEIHWLYDQEEIDRIREVGTYIVENSGLNMDKAHEKINKSLEKEDSTLYRRYLSVIKQFGVQAQEIELVRHFPKLSIITDKYTRDQLRAIALGQDPIFNQIAWQNQMNMLFFHFKQIKDQVSGIKEEEYWKQTDLKFLYGDYQIKRIRDIANFIISKENSLKLNELAEKLNQYDVIGRFNASNLTRVKLMGQKKKYVSPKNLPRFVDLHYVSSTYSREDLRLIALGQTPQCLIEKEEQQLVRFRETIESVQIMVGQASANLFENSWVSRIDQPSFNCLKDYLSWVFREKGLQWKAGTAKIAKLAPGYQKEIIRICKGERIEKDSDKIIAALRWSIGKLSGDLMSTNSLRRLLENN